MPLFADRFISQDGTHAMDLATGERVVLVMSRTGEEAERCRWEERCDTLQKLHHPVLAELVDYGDVGNAQCFEAWRCQSVWSGPSPVAAEITERASAVLEASGLVVAGPGTMAVAHPRAEPVVVPHADTGCPLDRLAAASSLPLGSRGVHIQPRRATGALVEFFERREGTRPKVAAFWGPEGAGKRTVVSELARTARRYGFVPLSTRLFDSAATHVEGRSLFLIGDGDRATAWRALMLAALAARLPHVLLFVGTEEVPCIDGVALEPLRAEALVAAVSPAVTNDLDIARARRAAIRAGGWPGRFARLLWGEEGNLRVAEQAASYEADTNRRGPTVRQAVPDDLAPHRRRAEIGMRLIDAGRHAPGERNLRQAIGALSRRADWSHAGPASLALAELLVRRGRIREAQVALRRARDCWDGADAATRLIDVSIVSGTALTELGLLEEAETVLSAAGASARSSGDLERTSRSLAGLARVLFWQGRYDDADRLLASLGPVAGTDRWSIRRRRLAAAIAVGRRAFDLAVSQSDEATRCASESAAPGPIAEAACGAALAHLAVGDLAAVERDVGVCVRAAHALREPLLAARARIVLSEALRRSGRRVAAARILARIGRLGAGALPPIVRARCELLRDVLAPDADVQAIVARHTTATGLKALELYVPAVFQSKHAVVFEPILDDIVQLLDICQTSADEPGILADVCRRLRVRSHAVAAACVVQEGSTWSVLAADGARIDASIAARTVDLGATIPPHRLDDRLEAGAPVRYGGTIVGAIVLRWPLAVSHDLGHVAGLLTATAAVVAPIFSYATVKRRRTPVPGLSEIIGVSPAMTDVRHAVERAAAAPFSVLVEGESGAGKEIVARALHRCGPRRDRPFGALNCAALPDDLVEAELFGHARGAYTGAVVERAGVFEDAHGGTLFLDEIGELSLRAQAKVLRVLQDGELKRVGENAPRRIDVRIVAATNRDLRQEVAAGRFRLDLSYRLDVIRIAVPPLRERREDIAVLAEHFWRESASRVGSRAMLASATLAALSRYDWPGNVRELQNVLAALVVRSPKRGVVPPTALGPQFAECRYSEASRLEEARRTFEERFVRATLVRTGGQRSWAARELGITRQGLSKLMARLGIADESADAGR
jgi:DNA-binding NtrC family response regulator